MAVPGEHAGGGGGGVGSRAEPDGGRRMCPRACTPRERKCLRKRLRQEGGGRRRWSGSGSGGRREAGRRRGVSHRESGARRADFFPSSPHPPTRPPPRSDATPFPSSDTRVSAFCALNDGPLPLFPPRRPAGFGKQMTGTGNTGVWSAAIFAAGIRQLVNCFEVVASIRWFRLWSPLMIRGISQIARPADY